MDKPSSTITAAGLVGLAIAALFGTVNEFTEITVSAGYVALVTSVVSSAVGYFWPEKTLRARWEAENK